MNYEIKRYQLKPPFNRTTYKAIFRDGEKTNFWIEDDGNEESAARLEKYLSLLQLGVIDREAQDQCSFLKWKPREVISYSIDNLPVEIRQKIDYANKLYQISGNNTEGNEAEYIERGSNEITTQYSKVLNKELTAINSVCLVVIWPYGADYYAI